MKKLLMLICFTITTAVASAQSCSATITANSPTTFCNGSSVTLTSTVNGSDFWRDWYRNGNLASSGNSSSFVATEGGDYFCKIQNGQCGIVFSPTVTITVLIIPSATITTIGATYICAGDSVSLTANTGNGVSWQWQKNGANISFATNYRYYAKSTGIYTCIETNICGGDTSNSVSIAVNQLPIAKISSAGATKFCPGNTVSASLKADTAAGTTYQWRKNNVDIVGANSFSYSLTVIGNYSCRITNCYGSSISNTIQIAIDSSCTNCLYFDKSDDIATIPPNTIYNVGGSYTVEAVIRLDMPQVDPSTETIISNFGPNDGNGMRLNLYNGRLMGWGPDLRDGQCHRVAVTYSIVSNFSFFYVDGVQIVRTSWGRDVHSTLPLIIGAENNGATLNNYFKGLIREIRFWNTSFHFSDMNNVLEGSINPNLIGYWRLNEGMGQTVTDYSITANHGVRGSTSGSESLDPAWSTGCPACTLPNVSISANGATTFCFGGSVALNAQPVGAGYNYQWRKNGAIINGATASSYNATTGGVYDVLVSNFCSSYSNALSVVVNGSLNNFIIQPNAAAGIDAMIANTHYPYDSNINFGNVEDLKINAWTQYSTASQRALLRFDLSALPTNTVVSHAVLTLYNSPTAILSGGPSVPAGTHYHAWTIPNASWLQKVTAPWDENTVTWNNQPSVSTINQATLPQDTNPHQDYQINVSSLVQDMISSPSTNYGFKLKLINESYYTSLLFASSDYPDSTKWPRLSVFYYDNSTSITASGSTAICQGSSVTLNAIISAGATYQWLKNGTSISGATSASYPANTAGNYKCIVSNNCSSDTSNTIAVTIINAPSTPGTISGVAKPCPGDTGVAYSVPAVANTVTYNWIVPTGVTISSGSGTRSIKVNFGTNFISGTISVSTSNGCGTSALRNKSVSRNIPATPSTITGTTYGLCGATNKVYSVTQVAGMTYQWTVPVVANIVNGQGTNSITVNFPSSNFTGAASVKAVNACGAGNARNLTVRAIPLTPISITGPTTACANQQNVAYSTAAVATATSYTWGVPSGALITSGQGTNSIVMKFGASGGNVKVRATNGCGNSSYRNLAVTINCREGAENFQPLQDVLVYPNPSKNYFTINISNSVESNYSLIVLDVIGRTIYHKENISTAESFDFGATFSNGAYFLEIKQGEERKMIRLIKSN